MVNLSNDIPDGLESFYSVEDQTRAEIADREILRYVNTKGVRQLAKGLFDRVILDIFQIANCEHDSCILVMLLVRNIILVRRMQHTTFDTSILRPGLDSSEVVQISSEASEKATWTKPSRKA